MYLRGGVCPNERPVRASAEYRQVNSGGRRSQLCHPDAEGQTLSCRWIFPAVCMYMCVCVQAVMTSPHKRRHLVLSGIGDGVPGETLRSMFILLTEPVKSTLPCPLRDDNRSQAPL
ncbi:hypothetical protein BAUCODRAFT_37979 [Baudoinia panamericana UAMH 10762]|uniref:Uncharacterized protein n=1 Tax=Baudoinia panamericana (strain UAMH 10762) TaxID=717646 RepID=M2M9I3_BAUPA|nr:uncharacterized protein BAUCODRAFT_37979 [Baudoinia panamericana UAMH 10762]EMC93061.1 hypothetical protein BAUCODRAFT_37979 [Baudoinia panamericana UAMH 10762]